MKHVIVNSSEYLKRMDPTGRGRRFVAQLRTSCATPTPKFFRRADYLSEYLQSRSRWDNQGTFSDLWCWEDELIPKFGPQGAGCELHEMLASANRSYQYADRHITFAPALYWARDSIIEAIRHRIEVVGPPQPIDVQILKTCSGLPYMMPKNQWQARADQRPWRHMIANIAGHRHMRQSHRTIYMDAVDNVTYIESALAMCRKWLIAQFPDWFLSWKNPMDGLFKTITQHVLYPDAWSVETDYVKCDEHFGVEIVLELILPIYETLLTPGEYLHFAAAVEELFYQELFLGNVRWTGKHNLFSGQSITSDFETLFDRILCIAAFLCDDRDMNRVATTKCLVLGDDIAVLLRGSQDAARRVWHNMIELGSSAGMEFHDDEKSGLRHKAVAFLRRYTRPGLPTVVDNSGSRVMRGYYPGVLTLNTIFHPEKQSDSLQDEMRALFQRLDNYFGAPTFAPMCQFVASMSTRGALFVPPADEAPTDWWYRLYGESWDPSSSPSVRTLITSHQVVDPTIDT